MRSLAEAGSVVPHFGGVTASERLKPHSFIGVIPTHLESEFHQGIPTYIGSNSQVYFCRL